VLTPLVLGPGAGPIVTEQAVAREAPELAVLVCHEAKEELMI
jgi:hypothetical protein